MHIKIIIDAETLKRLVIEHLADRLGNLPLDKEDITIEVKSKQNYKSEWEPAEFRATYEKHTL